MLVAKVAVATWTDADTTLIFAATHEYFKSGTIHTMSDSSIARQSSGEHKRQALNLKGFREAAQGEDRQSAQLTLREPLAQGSHESVGHGQGGAAEGDARCEAGKDSIMSGRAWDLINVCLPLISSSPAIKCMHVCGMY